MSCSTARKRELPFLLAPVGKDYLWGGDRLKTEYHKDFALTPLAETWECGTHPEGTSRLATEEAGQGELLSEVLLRHPEYLGTRYAGTPEAAKGELPILVKLIDARTALSVQVHPSDDYAREKENGARGKTELWYILDAEEDARLVYGFAKDVTKEELRNALANGSVSELLNVVSVRKGDVFYIAAGTVHAIGAGIVLAEIQECSNLTYRLFDYDRVDKNGKKRELHIEKALEVLTLESMVGACECKEQTKVEASATQEPRYKHGRTLLADCEYFRVEELTSSHDETAIVPTDERAYQVLLCVDGEGELFTQSYRSHVRKGDCFFVPAFSESIACEGSMKLLVITG